jgi:hypothetical protein
MVGRPDGADAADLGGLLSSARQPQAEFALALQVVCLLVELPGEDHVAIEPADGLRRDASAEPAIAKRTVGVEELHWRRGRGIVAGECHRRVD